MQSLKIYNTFNSFIMKFKFYFSLLLTALLGFALVGCDKDVDPVVDEPPVVKFEKDPFSLTVSGSTIDDVAVAVEINSGVEVENYLVGVATAEQVEAAGSDSLAIAKVVLSGLLEAENCDVATVDDTYIYNGAAKAEIAKAWELEYSSTYYVVACEVDAEGEITSGVNHVEFTTDAEPVVEPELIEDAFTFTTSLVGINNITLEVVKDEAVEYYYLGAISTKAFATGYGSDAEYFISTIINAANATSTDLEEQADAGLVYSVSREFTASSLVSTGVEGGTEYTFIAVGVASDGSYSTTVSTYTETTDEPLASDAFTLEVHDVETNGAMVKITPISSIGNYYVVCQPYSMVEQYTGGDYAAMYGMMIQSAQMTGMVDFSQTDGIQVFSGEKDIDPTICYGYAFSPATMYSVIVAGVDASGNLTSDVSYVNITTTAEGGEEQGDPFVLTVGEISASDVKVDVEPSANVPYYYCSVVPKSVLDNYYDSDADFLVKDSFSFDFTDINTMVSKGLLYSGEQTISMSAVSGMPLAEGAEYVFVVLGVNAAGEAMTSMSLSATPAAGAVEPTGEMFTVDVAEVTSDNAKVNVTPDASVLYYYAYAAPTTLIESDYEGDILVMLKKGAKEWLDQVVAMGASPDVLISAGILYQGYMEFELKNVCGTLKAETEYQFGVIAISATGEILDDTMVTSTITTPAEGGVVEPATAFDVEVVEVVSNNAKINVTPDASVAYYYAYAAPSTLIESDYENDILVMLKGGAKEWLDQVVAMGASPDVLVSAGILYQGYKEFELKNVCGTLKADTEYQFGAIAIAADGTILDDTMVATTLTTPVE